MRLIWLEVTPNVSHVRDGLKRADGMRHTTTHQRSNARGGVWNFRRREQSGCGLYWSQAMRSNFGTSSFKSSNHSAAANSATALVLQIVRQRRGVAGRNRSARGYTLIPL